MKSYRNNDKENQGLFQNAQSTMRKFKNFGQQIKSKLKVIQAPSKPYQQHRLIKPPSISNYQNRSLKTEPDSTSRSKSVKFAENPTNTLIRKHSTNSILKNSSLKKNSSSQALRGPLSERNSLRNSSLKGSMCSSTFNEDDQSCQNNISNKVIKEKYEKILEALKRYHRKYTDQIFPPVKVSLDGNFCPKQDISQIKWVRISDVFKNKNLKVWNKNSEAKIISQNQKYKNIATTFNCLKNAPKILEKMFQMQKISEYGIYCIKINQNSVWKYIIIDDFIPVFKNANNENYSPAYLNWSSLGNQVQIWPFLLLKALSKFYSSYANIPVCGELCTLSEMMNISYRKYKIDNENTLKKMFETGKNYHSIMIGKDSKDAYHPIRLSIPNQQAWNEWCMEYTYQDSADTFKTKTLKMRQVKLKFVEIYQFLLEQYSYSGINLTRNIKQPMILRSFIIDEVTPFQLSLVQKQKRLHNNSNPQYIWIRVILALKQSTGYRWIDATYSNNKHLFIRGTLQMGQYYAIILPQWNDNNYDLSLIYRGNIPSKIQKKMVKDYPKILMEATMDLAQRYGKLNQINPNICAYNYIEKSMGLIIENINNQRHKGEVKIVRSVEGLTGKFPIEPMNQQFTNKNTIQICIKCMSHYTVVLRLLGGVDESILNLFDFGS